MMSYWNYRVMERDGYYGIYEVYYEDDGTISYCTEDEISPSGDSPTELLHDLMHYIFALGKPILSYDDLFSESPELPHWMALEGHDKERDMLVQLARDIDKALKGE